MASSEELYREIRATMDTVGSKMEQTLPFKKGGPIARRRGHQLETAHDLLDVEGRDSFMRRWLQRPLTKREVESPIMIVEDTVVMEDGKPASPSKDLKVLAAYYPDEGLALPLHMQGYPQDPVLKYVSMLHLSVVNIADADQKQGIREVPHDEPHPIPAA